MADLLQLGEQAIYSALTGSSALMALVNGVYDTMLPPGVDPNASWAIFQHISGGSENVQPSTSFKAKWRIECISPARATATAAAAAISTAILSLPLNAIPAWTLWIVNEEDFFSRIDTVLGVPYYRKGSFYTIGADAGAIIV